MEQPVNFDNLHAITDGNPELEAELFRIFLDSSESCMKALTDACASGDDGAWRREAHAFKGICLNLGAEPLGAICKHAQEYAAALPAEKEEMLSAMKQELARVRAIIPKTR